MGDEMRNSRKSALRQAPRLDQSGQAITEYVLILFIIVLAYFMISKGLAKFGIGRMLMRPINDSYAHAYRYGHPQAKGLDDGGPYRHPRAKGSKSFRIFINPSTNNGG
jgi:hypothetical protein